MKIKSIIKILLDIIMTALFTVLLFAYSTGLAFHEIMGLSVLILFGIHLALNLNWIINISGKLFNRQIKGKTLFMYLLNVGLLIGTIGIAITGLMISTVIIPHQITYNPVIVSIHKWLSYITVGFIAVHLALHTKYLFISVKKICAGIKIRSVQRILGGAFAAVMVAGIIYYNVISSVAKNLNAGIADDIESTPIQSTSTNEIIVPNIQKKDDEEDEEVITTSETQPAVISLSEFLSKMFCNLCPKHCALSNPRCGKSASLISEAKAEYQSLYIDE